MLMNNRKIWGDTSEVLYKYVGPAAKRCMVASDGSELSGNQDKKLGKPKHCTGEDGDGMLSDALITRVLRCTLRCTCE